MYILKKLIKCIGDSSVVFQLRRYVIFNITFFEKDRNSNHTLYVTFILNNKEILDNFGTQHMDCAIVLFDVIIIYANMLCKQRA